MMTRIIFQRVVFGAVFGLAAAMIHTFISIQTMEGQLVSYDWLNRCMRGYVILGVVFGPASLCFRIDKWSLLRQTITHFVIIFPSYIAVNVMNGWSKLTGEAFLSMLFIFIASYLVIWLGINFYWRMKIKQMNNILQR
ncbi:DUF3021 domain-containing protein [Paenibacillus assamensis]|uniref:DUF3021 domain-containing protein n=1 Tax=Paenibacillus assamensis TaxID=311244 RepID=UPI00048C888E|nr:DUF3021 domain-containing protein [Paenibacillus assamensis]